MQAIVKITNAKRPHFAIARHTENYGILKVEIARAFKRQLAI